MNQLHRNRAAIGALLALFVLVSLYALSIRTLVPPDEGRYAEMAREMLAGGDWITTRLDGIKYFEKPPLQAWMNALTFALFGLGEWQARLWTGLCAVCGVVLAGHAGTRLFGPRAGLDAALVLASCFYWAGFSQVDSPDMGLSAMLALALCALLLAQREDATAGGRRRWMLACWTGIVLPGAVLALYAIIARDRRILGRLHAGPGLLLYGLALLAAAPCARHFGLPSDEAASYAAWLGWIDAAGLLLLGGGALALWCARTGRRGAYVLALAVAGFGATQLLVAGSDTLGRRRAGADLVPTIARALAPRTHLYSVGQYAQSLTFYLGRPLTLVAYEDEFAFGLAQEPAAAIPTVPAFIEQWRRDTAAGEPSVAIVRPDIVADLQRQHVPLRILGADAMRTVIANR